MNLDFRIGDPVMDAAQGRPMQVVSTPDQTVAEWSDANDYDLTENYGNAKFDPDPAEPAVECVYASDVRSEPSKTYTFPASRLRLIDVHHADDGRRVYDRVARDVLEQLLIQAHGTPYDFDTVEVLETIIGYTDIDPDVIDEARELADVEWTIAADGGDD